MIDTSVLCELGIPFLPVTCLTSFPFCRYHRCQGDPDGHLFTHRLLTEGFREDEVNQPGKMKLFYQNLLKCLSALTISQKYSRTKFRC